MAGAAGGEVVVQGGTLAFGTRGVDVIGGGYAGELVHLFRCEMRSRRGRRGSDVAEAETFVVADDGTEVLCSMRWAGATSLMTSVASEQSMRAVIKAVRMSSQFLRSLVEGAENGGVDDAGEAELGERSFGARAFNERDGAFQTVLEGVGKFESERIEQRGEEGMQGGVVCFFAAKIEVAEAVAALFGGRGVAEGGGAGGASLEGDPAASEWVGGDHPSS